MTIYVNPFVMGVIATLVVEFIALLGYGLIKSKKK